MWVKYYYFLLNQWVAEDRICQVSHIDHWGLLSLVSISILSRKLVSDQPRGVLLWVGSWIISWPFSLPPKLEMFCWNSAYVCIFIFLWIHPHHCLVQMRGSLLQPMPPSFPPSILWFTLHRVHPFDEMKPECGLKDFSQYTLSYNCFVQTKEQLVLNRTTWDVHSLEN